MSSEKTVHVLLRVGVAFAFLFPPIHAVFNPYSWVGYFPKFAHGYVPDLMLLHSFGVVEVVLALWILSGRRIFFPSLFATFMLITIVMFNLNNFEVLFRDLSIAVMALALAVGSWAERNS